MADTFSKAERSRIMAAVKSKHTTPEMAVRRLVHSLGYRYRLHVTDLPGTPDLVFPGLRRIIEVRGCFWHGHDCGRCRIPATRREYWLEKINRNQRRDSSTQKRLRGMGWKLLVIWECDLAKLRSTERRISRFLGERVSHRKSSGQLS